MQNVRPCCLCGNMRVNGISILQHWICSECVKELSVIDDSHLFYEFYIDEIKNIWDNYIFIKGGGKFL